MEESWANSGKHDSMSQKLNTLTYQPGKHEETCVIQSLNQGPSAPQVRIYFVSTNALLKD